MTKITINQEELNKTIDKETTIKEIADTIQEELSHKNQTIISVQMDGVEHSFGKCIHCFNNNINHYQKINFITRKKTDLAVEALDSCSTYIDEVIKKIHFTIDLYNQNDKFEANKAFTELIEIMDLFIQLIIKINETLKVETNKGHQKPKEIQQLEVHLLSTLKAIVPAKEKDDIIMLCDLLEYELIDNLTQWKTKAIPQLKEFRKN